jgi:hypothetical protein
MQHQCHTRGTDAPISSPQHSHELTAVVSVCLHVPATCADVCPRTHTRTHALTGAMPLWGKASRYEKPVEAATSEKNIAENWQAIMMVSDMLAVETDG